MSDVLITDSLFLNNEDHKAAMTMLRDAGHTVTRLDKPKADPEELKIALRGKAGYILGGVERVTDDVISAALDLRAIAFTGSAFGQFIPGWKTATEQGIAISAARGANADSVAEWALVNALSLVRNIPALTTSGSADFYIARECRALTVGILGYGNIGRALRQKALALGMRVVVTDSSFARADLADVVDLPELIAQADVVSVHVSQARGTGALDRAAMNALKPGTVVVNASFEEAIDNEALLERLVAGDIKAAVDYPLKGANEAPAGLLASKAQTAFNTSEANARVSTRTAEALINLLTRSFDRDLVNPEFLRYR